MVFAINMLRHKAVLIMYSDLVNESVKAMRLNELPEHSGLESALEQSLRIKLNQALREEMPGAMYPAGIVPEIESLSIKNGFTIDFAGASDGFSAQAPQNDDITISVLYNRQDAQKIADFAKNFLQRHGVTLCNATSQREASIRPEGGGELQYGRIDYDLDVG